MARPIGFELVTDLTLLPAAAGVRCIEVGTSGAPIGELQVEVFAAALVIDRDGILESKVSELAGAQAKYVTLPGATGYCASRVERGTPLPYLHVFAMAPSLGIDGGLLVTIRSAKPEWPAADAVLRSLRILTRHGVAPANDEISGSMLPLVDDD
jgi:hypothetical protein